LRDYFSVAIDQEVDLATTEGSALDLDIEVALGTFDEVGVKLGSKASLKGFCRINGDELLYTTEEGPKVTTCDNWETCEMPADYDFMEKEAGEGIRYETLVTVEEDSTPNIALLASLSYSLACWDGVGDLMATDEEDRLQPFAWETQGDDGNFPSGQPYLEFYDLPAFVFVSTDVDEPLPVVETYMLSAETDAALHGDYTGSNFYSFVFRSNGEYYGAFGIHFGDGPLGSGLSRFLDDTAEVDGNDIKVHAGSGLWSPEHHPDRNFIRLSTLSFTRAEEIGDTGTGELLNGPDCGQEFLNWADHDEGKECMEEDDGYPLPVHFKRIAPQQ
jgi:hypothetical protein